MTDVPYEDADQRLGGHDDPAHTMDVISELITRERDDYRKTLEEIGIGHVPNAGHHARAALNRWKTNERTP